MPLPSQRVVLLLCLSCVYALGCGQAGTTPTAARLNLATTTEVAAVETHQVKALCGSCHAYPPPDSLPRELWDEEVKRGFRFFEEARRGESPLPLASVIKYYQQRAPEEFPELPVAAPPTDPCCRFERQGYRPPNTPPTPAVSNVRCVHLFDDKRVEILACEMLRGQIWLLRPGDQDKPWQLLSDELAHPGHVEVVDLDRDGVKDLVVAELGDFFPTDEKKGSVVWLRGLGDGKFQKHVLATRLGRVADVQAADFNGDGKLDLVVAEFGWQRVGRVLLLENQTSDYAKPAFVEHVVDPRHGAIHVPVVDLNDDGQPDFVVLLSQDHETVVAFINQGQLRFKAEEIFTGPHPAYGSSGIQLVDFDKDGKTDVLYTNGDSLNRTMLRPYHGVHLLMNRGGFPFEDNQIGLLYGVHRAVAADFEGKGQLDILATSFLPEPGFTDLRQRHLEAIVLFRQTKPMQFERHVLEKRTCDHATADVADVDGDGRPDFVVGNFSLLGAQRAGPRTMVTSPPSADMVAVWRNLGRPPATTADAHRP